MVLRQIFEMPLHRLAIGVAIGAAAVQSFGYFARASSADNITYKDYYRDAMSLAKTHPGTEHLFGSPIHFKGLDAANSRRLFYTSDKYIL